MSNFDSDTLHCEPTMFLAINSPNSAKSNLIFPGKGRGDRALILTYLVSSMTEDFLGYCLFFSILAISKRNLGVKVGPKVHFLGPSLFHKNSNPSKYFQTMFLFARVLPLVRIPANLDKI